MRKRKDFLRKSSLVQHPELVEGLNVFIKNYKNFSVNVYFKKEKGIVNLQKKQKI